MLKNRLLVLIDAVLNCIIIAAATIIGKAYISNCLDNLNFPSNQEISKIYVIANFSYIIFLIIVCVILNYIQYTRNGRNLSNPRQFLIINILISIIPFTLPILLTCWCSISYILYPCCVMLCRKMQYRGISLIKTAFDKVSEIYGI